MNAGAIEIRRLAAADAPLFRDIRLEGLQRDPDAFGSTFERESTEPLSFFVQRLEDSAVFGAFEGDALIGVAGFAVQAGAKHAHKGLLWGMYVRPDFRGSGIGRRLVERGVDHARGRVELIQLVVISENLAARRLYRGLGFEEYGLERHAAKYRDRYHDDVLMAKMLIDFGSDPAAEAH
jgi:ribosomal protein S18 acetylase RimI-like enzyme